MDIAELIVQARFLWSPLVFALLVGFAALLVWLAFAPIGPRREVGERLDGYLDRGDVIELTDMGRPFAVRVLAPLLRRILHALGRLAPMGNIEATEQMLIQAGRPYGLTGLDFLGLRVLTVILFAAGYYFLLGRSLPPSRALLNMLIAVALGYLLPRMWLRRRVRLRQHEIVRALPDALDMLTVGVEAGLAFESALLRVSEQWDNALSQEFRRAVAEMRVGVSRNDALRSMADRTGVDDLRTLVAVLVQSSQLGVSIAHVLHTQAEQMRVRRRQRAEELARQASVKMVFPLVFLIFPAMYVVVLGPAIPGLLNLFRGISGGG